MKKETTILLAEDDEDDVMLLRRAFQKAEVGGLQVVRNGDEAIHYLMGAEAYGDRTLYPFPGVLLIDIKMPRRSGLEVLQWVRQREPIKRLPIVVLSSSPSVREINEAHQYGANSYLVKPTEFQELVKLIRAFAEYWLYVSKLPSLP